MRSKKPDKQQLLGQLDYALHSRLLSLSATTAGIDCSFHVGKPNKQLLWDLGTEQQARLRASMMMIVHMCMVLLFFINFPVNLHAALVALFWISLHLLPLFLLRKFPSSWVAVLIVSNYCLWDSLATGRQTTELPLYLRMLAVLPCAGFLLHRKGILVMLVVYILITVLQNQLNMDPSKPVKSELDVDGPPLLTVAFYSCIMVLCEGAVQVLDKLWEASVNARADLRVSMSHELRTPLFSVIGAIDLMKKTKIDEWQTQLVRFVDRTAYNILSIVSALLDFSRISSGEIIDLERRWLPTEDIFYGAVHICQPLAVERGVVILSQIDPGPVRYFYTDGIRLHQVFTTHILDAIKRAPPGSLLSVNFSAFDTDVSFLNEVGIQMKGVKPLRAVQLCVTNHKSPETSFFHGSGDPSLNPSEPKPPRRVPANLKMQLSYSLLERLGGVRTDDRNSSSSTFTITVASEIERNEPEPVAHSPDPSRPTRPTPELASQDARTNFPLLHPPGKDKFRLLIAEDNEINQLLLAKMCELLQVHARIVSHGLDVVRLLVPHWEVDGLVNSKPIPVGEDYDAILLDLEMPVMDGIECVKTLTRLNVKLPIVVMSAHSLDDQRRLLRGVPVKHLLLKPVTTTNLYNTLHCIVSGGP